MKNVLSALLVIVIAILAWLAWPRMPGDDSGDDFYQDHSDKPIPTKASVGMAARSRASLPTKGPARPPQAGTHVAPSHEADELVDFIIPALDFEDAPVQSALLTLMAEYTRICQETGEVPGVFNVSLLTEPQGVINMHLQDVSFLGALDLIAMLAGLELSREGFQLVFDAEERDPAAPRQTRVERLVEQLATQDATMIESEVRFLDTEEALRLSGGRLDPAETEALLARAAAIPGTTLEAKPSVVTRPGQTATIEVGEELIRPVPGAADQFQTDWIGVRIELRTARYGFDLQGGGSVFDQSMNGGRIASGNVQLQRSEQEFLAVQDSGQTVVVETSTPQGSPRYVLVTHHLVDPSGRPIAPKFGDR